ncbi:DUF1697 domain-containing protein [Calidifontibacter terrae]
MTTRVAFLRAVNVSGRQVLMERLRGILTEAGFRDVATHIQTGNVLVTTSLRSDARIIAALEKAILDELGFEVPVMLRQPADLRRIVEEADAYEDPLGSSDRRYVTLLGKPASAEAAKVFDQWDAPGERLRVNGSEVHWWLTRSTHAAKISNARLEKLLGPGTTRDLKVMRALADKWAVS